MSLTVELPRAGTPGTGLGGLWRVVVLNDEFNTFDHVAETLSRVVPGVTLADGDRIRVGAWTFLKLGLLVMPPALALAIGGVLVFSWLF